MSGKKSLLTADHILAIKAAKKHKTVENLPAPPNHNKLLQLPREQAYLKLVQGRVEMAPFHHHIILLKYHITLLKHISLDFKNHKNFSMAGQNMKKTET